MLNSAPALVKFLFGFALIYGILDGMAPAGRCAADRKRPPHHGCSTHGRTGGRDRGVPSKLAAGAPALGLRLGWRALGVALLITVLQLAAYPLITWLTGYRWVLPPNWPWTMVGIFALHGVAEEVLYRSYLFGRLRHGRTFWRAAWLVVLLFA